MSAVTRQDLEDDPNVKFIVTFRGAPLDGFHHGVTTLDAALHAASEQMLKRPPRFTRISILRRSDAGFDTLNPLLIAEWRDDRWWPGSCTSAERSRLSRVADRIRDVWSKLFDNIVPGFGTHAAVAACANNSVVEAEDGSVEVHARDSIVHHIEVLHCWPALTEDQIARFVAAAYEAERNEPR